MKALGGPDRYEELLRDTIGYAARYGHQQFSEIMNMTQDELTDFNEGIQGWIHIEQKSGRGVLSALGGGG